MKYFREAINYLTEYVLDQEYDLRFALEAKPNEPRADLYLPTTGAMLAFIETLDNREMVGVNPELAHEHMAGLNFLHAVAQAWESGKLFHIDLNDQLFGRYDQDFRFGAAMIKQAFYLVKFLEDVHYENPKHFDAHAYRTEDEQGVVDFAAGCIRTYLILEEKAQRFNEDKEIQELLTELRGDGQTTVGSYTSEKALALKDQAFDRLEISKRGFRYERLDQLTVDLLLGVR